MSDVLTWPEPFFRGLAGAIAFIVLFVAARWRWKGRGRGDEQADVGLD
ncbi:hypothetical protein [Modestobacter sp. URMC 112]